MVNTTNLLNELVDMGHSEKWSKKKVKLTEVDNAIERLGMQVDILVGSGKPYKLISAELNRLQEEVNKLQDKRDQLFSELSLIED